MKIITLTLLIAASIFSLNAQIVTIPDANFKACLVGDTAINTNGDNEIQITEANAYTGAIGCWSQSISDLTGIAAFTSATSLSVQYNNLTTLDVSQNTALTILTCGQNNLSALDVSNNTALEVLYFAFNNISTIDVSQNTALTQLVGFNNSLTSLNVANGNNTNFISFNATVNPNLTCIQVDDVTYSNLNWPNLDTTATYNLNCGGTVLVNSIVVNGQGGATTITTNNGTLQMQATILPTNATNPNYNWSLTNGTGTASIDASGLVTAATNGTVTVTATASDGSGIMGNAVITLSNQGVTSINNHSFDNLNCYPNPAVGVVNISTTEKITSIKLLDLTGKTIQTFNPESNQIDVSVMETGVYFLEIANSQKLSVVKLILE